MKQQKGFTLIELVMVIVIIGILSAVALPKYIDLTTKANTAAAAGIASALASGTAVNFASRAAGVTTGTAAVADCTAAASTIIGGLPSGYTITSAAVASGATQACTLTGPTTAITTSFTAIGAT